MQLECLELSRVFIVQTDFEGFRVLLLAFQRAEGTRIQPRLGTGEAAKPVHDPAMIEVSPRMRSGVGQDQEMAQPHRVEVHVGTFDALVVYGKVEFACRQPPALSASAPLAGANGGHSLHTCRCIRMGHDGTVEDIVAHGRIVGALHKFRCRDPRDPRLPLRFLHAEHIVYESVSP